MGWQASSVSSTIDADIVDAPDGTTAIAPDYSRYNWFGTQTDDGHPWIA